VKGLYKKARSGEIAQFTGISDPYEPPENPEIHLHTEQENPEQDVEIILEKLRDLGLLPVDPIHDDSAYTPEEEALVSERLKNLGYL
jgi:adenylylsulfate kinase